MTRRQRVCEAKTGAKGVYLRVDSAAQTVSGRTMRETKMKINMNISMMVTDVTAITSVMVLMMVMVMNGEEA